MIICLLLVTLRNSNQNLIQDFLSTCNKIDPIENKKVDLPKLNRMSPSLTNPKLLETVETLQRKPVRPMARTTDNDHTDPLFKQYSILTRIT